ncbi:MAG: DUF1515 domain-containing protein [Alphaproteobacteria bacterium]|nr:DUF1515 domain-containing protein [Alphaproteobacteria bacterium]
MDDESGKIQRALGNVEGSLHALAETVKAQGDRSEDGRRRLYERIELSDEKVAAATAQAAEAVRVAAETKAAIADDVMPTIKEVRNWKISGMTIIAVVGIGGAAIGAFVIWAWDVIFVKLRF